MQFYLPVEPDAQPGLQATSSNDKQFYLPAGGNRTTLRSKLFYLPAGGNRTALRSKLFYLPAGGNTPTLRSKLFYLPVQLDAHPGLLAGDTALQRLTRVYRERVQQSRRECGEAACYAEALRLSPDEIARIGDRLLAHYAPGNGMSDVVQAVRADGYYNKEAAPGDTALLRFAWEQTAAGMNYIFNTYVAGKRCRYPIIDSISFNTSDPAFR